MKKTKKFLSIILAILMIATTVPFAFAADEIPDFSDAKVLSTDADGYLCIDGERIEVYLTNTFNEERQPIPSGKYKLEGDMISNGCTAVIQSQENVIINLNGYKWTFEGYHFIQLVGELSVYDLSEKETGKLVAETHWGNVSLQGESSPVFNLYSGTLESIGGTALRVLEGTVNLYGGKLKSDKYTIDYIRNGTEVINLDDVVLESGEGYAQIDLHLSNYEKETIIDVTDYTGDALEIDSEIDCLGKVEILKGIKSAEDAEKYKINVEPGYSYLFHEKTGYDEENGTKYVSIAQNAFTQQPSAENNYTVDFNNPAATFQWYEVGENYIGKYIAERFMSLFSYDFKAGDTLKVSTDSDLKLVYLRVGDRSLTLRNEKTATVKFDTDGRMNIESMFVDAENPVELEFSVIKETELEGETGKTLQNPECGKLYWCKATVGAAVYTSDTVVGHVITQVDAKAKTCTEIGWDAYVYCTVCDYTTYNEIPASHEIVNVEAQAPTCTEIGWDAYEYCTDCDYTTYVEKAALDHDIVIDAYVAPQCTETGLTAGQHCSRCDDMTVVQEVIPALGHINEDGNTTCDRCDEILLCEDCGRPVHKEEGIPKYICWLITLIKMIVSFFK